MKVSIATLRLCVMALVPSQVEATHFFLRRARVESKWPDDSSSSSSSISGMNPTDDIAADGAYDDGGPKIPMDLANVAAADKEMLEADKQMLDSIGAQNHTTAFGVAANSERGSPSPMASSGQSKQLEARLMAMAADPKSDVLKYLEKTLVSHLLNTSQDARTEVDEIQSAFKKCFSLEPRLDRGTLGELNASLRVMQTDHKECREKEAKLYTQDQECKLELKANQAAVKAACSKVDMLRLDADAAPGQCKVGASYEYEDWLKGTVQKLEAKLKEFKEAREVCKQQRLVEKAKGASCKRMTSRLVSQREECNVKQASMEKRFCEVKASHEKGAAEFATCFERARKVYDERIPVIKKEETLRKEDWVVVSRVKCILMKKEDCMAGKVNTSHLDLKIEDAPHRPPIAGVGPMPGEADFVGRVYADLPKHAPPADVNACPNSPPLVFPHFGIGKSKTGERICAGNAVYEFTADWDCEGGPVEQIPSAALGQKGWRDGFDSCSKACAKHLSCASFSFPKAITVPNCTLKSGARKSASHGWTCGSKARKAKPVDLFSKLPGLRCQSEWSIPRGILREYDVSKVPKSWKKVMDEPYGKKKMTMTDVFPEGKHVGECMLMGAKKNKLSDTFDVVAFGRRAKIQKVGKRGAWENGAFWYNWQTKSLKGSVGFAPTSSTTLNSCDMYDTKSKQRLCWHYNRGVGGWRAGRRVWLNRDQTWRKVVMYGPCSYKD